MKIFVIVYLCIGVIVGISKIIGLLLKCKGDGTKIIGGNGGTLLDYDNDGIVYSILGLTYQFLISVLLWPLEIPIGLKAAKNAISHEENEDEFK